MAKEVGKLYIAFCDKYWKPFLDRKECIKFIEKQDLTHQQFWSYTVGNVDFYTPYLTKYLISADNSTEE